MQTGIHFAQKRFGAADIVCGGGSCLNGGMIGGLSISLRGSLACVQAASARWIAGALVLTSAAWLVALAGLLALANRVHDDVPLLLAVKLPLLQARPELIFPGENRTLYQGDANFAPQLIGRPQGAGGNIAYEAGGPLARLAALRPRPHRFRKGPLSARR